jgi:hypothetical protein
MLEPLGVYVDEDFPGGKSLYCLSSASLSELASSLRVPSRHFALLLAADATGWRDEDVLAAARTLVEKGLALLVAWGPDCERVHDLFDHARGPDEPAESVLLTTWHGDETLDEALWYFVGCAAPAEAYLETCPSWVAASISHPGWAEHIRARMEGSKTLLRATGDADEECCDVIEAVREQDTPPPE